MEVMTNTTANGDPTEAPEALRKGTMIPSVNWRKLGMLFIK